MSSGNYRYPHIPGLLGILLVLVVAAACTRGPEPEETAVVVPQVDRSDSWITTSVQARYYADDAVRGGQIDVTANDGVVTLAGTVENEAARQRALTLAREVEGVTRVEDRLQVAAPGTAAGTQPETRKAPAEGEPTQQPQQQGPQQTQQQPAAAEGPAGTAGSEARVRPGWITTKIQAQYFMNPEIRPWNIDVTTTSAGVVMLRGEVESKEDKDVAVQIARATEGVTRVEDHLRLKGEPTTKEAAEDTEFGPVQPDAWITAKVQAKYFLDDQVKARDINVDTNEGVVTLTGIVQSDAERRQALALARNTDGVRNVVDKLEVRAAEAAAADRTPGAAGPAMEMDQKARELWITTNVQSKYFLDTELKRHDINVDTTGAIVTLKGTVPSDALKQQAEQIARETAGVKRVQNLLVVKPQ